MRPLLDAAVVLAIVAVSVLSLVPTLAGHIFTLTKNATHLYDKMAPLPPDALAGYDEIFNQDGVRLFHSKALAPKT